MTLTASSSVSASSWPDSVIVRAWFQLVPSSWTELGVTPLEVKLDKTDAHVTFKFELEGRQTVERQVSLVRNNALSVDLAAAVVAPPVIEKSLVPPSKPAAVGKKKVSTSRDGVVDPFDR